MDRTFAEKTVTIGRCLVGMVGGQYRRESTLSVAELKIEKTYEEMKRAAEDRKTWKAGMEQTKKFRQNTDR